MDVPAPLGYEEALEVLRGWCGRPVTLVHWAPRFERLDRPYRGVLRYDEGQSREDVAVFAVPTDPRAEQVVNPGGITIAVHRDAFTSAEWVGAAAPGAGLSIRQGEMRVSVFPDP